jgi:hypothetical protein
MLTKTTQDQLHDQLIKLGDMMGDGLHHEPDGKWISVEYRKVCRALGLVKSKPRDAAGNNDIAARASENACLKCQGSLKQTRSGSLRLVCTSCGQKFQIKSKR